MTRVNTFRLLLVAALSTAAGSVAFFGQACPSAAKRSDASLILPKIGLANFLSFEVSSN